MVRLSVSPFWLWSNHLTALIPVLMEIDGVKIADDGTISFRDNERVGVDYLFGTQLSLSLLQPYHIHFSSRSPLTWQAASTRATNAP